MLQEFLNFADQAVESNPIIAVWAGLLVVALVMFVFCKNPEENEVK